VTGNEPTTHPPRCQNDAPNSLQIICARALAAAVFAPHQIDLELFAPPLLLLGLPGGFVAGLSEAACAVLVNDALNCGFVRETITRGSFVRSVCKSPAALIAAKALFICTLAISVGFLLCAPLLSPSFGAQLVFSGLAHSEGGALLLEKSLQLPFARHGPRESVLSFGLCEESVEFAVGRVVCRSPRRGDRLVGAAERHGEVLVVAVVVRHKRIVPAQHAILPVPAAAAS
jgi:hypothetical protein